MRGSRVTALTGASGWLASLAVYREPRLIAILLMGFASGLPLALTGATLSLRLADIGVSLDRDRALHARPLLLQLQIPVVAADRPAADPDADRTARAASQLGTGAPGGLWSWQSWRWASPTRARIRGRQHSPPSPSRSCRRARTSSSTPIASSCCGPEEQGAGAAATQWGYRFGMLASGAGALYAASFGGWTFAYV